MDRCKRLRRWMKGSLQHECEAVCGVADIPVSNAEMIHPKFGSRLAHEDRLSLVLVWRNT